MTQLLPFEQNRTSFFKTVLNSTPLCSLPPVKRDKEEPKKLSPLPNVETFKKAANIPTQAPPCENKVKTQHQEKGEKETQEAPSAGCFWKCTWENCSYQQKGRTDIFKAKRHVWDKHLRRLEEYTHIFPTAIAPVFEQLSLNDRERVKESIMKFLTEASNDTKIKTTAAAPFLILPQQQKEEKKEEKVEEEVEEEEEEEKVVYQVEKKSLCCTWSGCDYVQQEKDIWKAKRHIWDKHLRSSDLFETLCHKSFAPSYGKLNQEEKKALDSKISKYIGEKVISHSKFVSPKKRKVNNFVNIKPRREKRRTATTVEEDGTRRSKRYRDDADETFSNKKKKITTRSQKLELPQMRPRPKTIPQEDLDKFGTLEWNPSMTNDKDLAELKEYCLKSVGVMKLDISKVYQIFMENNYNLIQTKDFISSNFLKIQKYLPKGSYILNEKDNCAADLETLNNLLSKDSNEC